jgi:hypothetical protein
VLKPSAINQSFTSNQSVIKPTFKMLSEADIAKKKEEIINSYSVKFLEIEDLISHYNERIKAWKSSDIEKGHPIHFDQKIKARLEQEEIDKRKEMEDEINKLKKGV